MCGKHAYLPKAMNVHAEYDRTSVALYRGGSADVWKRMYCGLDVAVKVIRTYSNSDLRKIIGVSCTLSTLFTYWCADQGLCRGSVRKS